MTQIDEKPANGNGAHTRTADKPSSKQLISGRNKPETGWQAVVANLMVAIGQPNLMPKPSRKEIKQRELNAKIGKLLQLVDQVESFTLGVFHFKGGAGKTPIATLVACLLSHLTGVQVAFVDGNPGSTSPGWRMGMWGGNQQPTWAREDPPLPGMYRQTDTIWQLYEKIEGGQVADGRGLSLAMKQNHYGVNTLVADRDKRRMNDDAKLAMFSTTIRFIQRHFRFIVIDTGNDYSTDAQQALAEMSSNLLIPAWVRRRVPLADLPHTLDELSDPRFGDKVQRAIVAMTGIVRGESVKDFASAVAGRDVANIIGIPYDRAIEDEYSIRLDLLQPDTREALIDILIAVLEQNVRAQQEAGGR